jgi:hypothetical protein
MPRDCSISSDCTVVAGRSVRTCRCGQACKRVRSGCTFRATTVRSDGHGCEGLTLERIERRSHSTVTDAGMALVRARSISYRRQSWIADISEMTCWMFALAAPSFASRRRSMPANASPSSKRHVILDRDAKYTNGFGSALARGGWW